MQISASHRLQDTRGTKEVTVVSWHSTRLEAKEGIRGAEVADAARSANAVDRLWTACERAEPRGQEEIDAKYPQNTRGAESATRRKATRPAQWSTRPDPSQETTR